MRPKITRSVAAVLAVLIVGVLFGLRCYSQSTHDPRRLPECKVEPAEAKNKYLEVANIMGLEVELKGVEVSKPTLRESGLGGAPYKILKVTSKPLNVQVDAHSGKIRFAVNEQATGRHHDLRRSSEKTGKTLQSSKTVADIVSISRRYAKQLGCKPRPDLRLERVRYDAQEGVWELSWNRYIGSYYFLDEGMWMRVADRDSALLLYGNTSTRRTCDTEVKISKEKAEAIARAKAREMLPVKAGSEDFRLGAIEEFFLQVRYPNYWHRRLLADRGGKELPPRPAAPRLVYCFLFDTVYVGDTTKGMTVIGPLGIWVDAITGEVVGGT